MGANGRCNDAQDWFGTTAVEEKQLILAINAPHSATKHGLIQTYVLRGFEWTQRGRFRFIGIFRHRWFRKLHVIGPD